MRRRTKGEREFERACILTLSDGTIWRYYNGSGLWEGLSGPFRACFGDTPTRADRAPLSESDGLRVREITHIGRLCSVMSLEQARADWAQRGAGHLPDQRTGAE